MSSYVWAKVFIEVLEDPKMGRLPDNLWRRVIELILLAKQYNKGGFIPGLADISWALRIPVEQLEADLEKISKIGTDYDPPRPILEIRDGNWFLTNFKKRQEAEPVKERVANYRKRNVTQSGNDSVTKCYTEEEVEVDIEADKTKSFGASAPTPEQYDASQDLRFEQTPSGAILKAKLDATYKSMKRRPPIGYKNGPQRDAYQEVFGKLGNDLPRLLDEAMEGEIIDRARLLKWLKGCVKKNGKHPPTQKPMTPEEQSAEFARLNPKYKRQTT